MKRGSGLSAGVSYGRALTAFALRSKNAPGGPVSAFIEPANVCNLRCPLCACGSGALTRPKGRMSIEAFRRVIDALPGSVGELYLWGQGEPFMAPDFLSMVAYASAKGFKTVTSTNGHYLDDPEGIAKSGLDVIVVSLDGADAETYKAYRVGGDFDRVVNGIRRLSGTVRSMGRGPRIELQYLVTAESAGQRGAFVRLAESVGADRVVFKTIQAASMSGGESYLPGKTELTRYRTGDDGRLETDRQMFLKNRCLRIYYSFQVDWRGNVLPCCFDKNSEYIMGNLFNDSFGDIWNSEEFLSFRNILVTSGRILPMCGDCTEGLKRKTIEVKKIGKRG